VAGVTLEQALRRRRCATLREDRRQLETVYVGGGTPSVLEPDLLVELVEGTAARWPQADGIEFTVEANPESFTRGIAKAWRSVGVNRISLGIQSLDEAVLSALGRRCDAATARAAVRLAVAEFPQVATDWILGPRLRAEPLLAGLAEIAAMGVGHVSLYILEVHPGTPLQKDISRGRARLPGDRRLSAIYLAAVERLGELGFQQYEVASFARPGQESRHNQGYWRRRPYLGLGPGAHGFWGDRRYANVSDVERYLQEVERSRLPEAASERLSLMARRLESLFLALRTCQGVRLESLPPGALSWRRGIDAGLWRIENGRLQLTASGFLQIDSIEEALARALLA
jgi:coproporphyrinogen III oxidase-like Fe-S oxidoreductase